MTSMLGIICRFLHLACGLVFGVNYTIVALWPRIGKNIYQVNLMCLYGKIMQSQIW